MPTSIADVDKQLHALLQELANDESEVRDLRKEVLNLEVVTTIQGEGTVADAAQISREQQRENIRREMPPQLLAELSSKRDLLKATRAAYLHALETKQTAEVTMDESFEEEDKREDHLEKLYTRAKWRPGCNSSYTCPIAVSDENSRLKKKLVELYHSRKVVESQTEKLTAVVKGLVAEVDSNSGLEKEHFTAETECRLKDFELREVREEIKMYQRILLKKNRMLIDVAASEKSKQFKVKMIEGDKRSAVVKLTQQRTTALVAVSTIRYTTVLLRQLEEKIEMIGEAVRGDVSNDPSEDTSDGLTDVPRVDVQLLEEVGQEVQHLAQEQLLNDSRLENIDGLIEVIERKLNVLNSATSKAITKTIRTQHENEDFLALLDEEYHRHEDDVADVADHLRSEIDEIKKATSPDSQ